MYIILYASIFPQFALALSLFRSFTVRRQVSPFEHSAETFSVYAFASHLCRSSSLLRNPGLILGFITSHCAYQLIIAYANCTGIYYTYSQARTRTCTRIQCAKAFYVCWLALVFNVKPKIFRNDNDFNL